MLPQSLKDEIGKAKEILKNSRFGNLPKYQRVKLWKLFGDGRVEMKAEYPKYLPGHIRRYYLQRLCVDKVMSIWESSFPNDKILYAALNESDRYIKRGYPPKNNEDRQTLNKIMSCVESVLDLGVPSLVGWAAADAFQMAITDTDEWLRSNAETMDDMDSEIYGWNADFCSSLAFANGLPEDEESDNSRRREFWEWYLNEAVLAAYKSV